MPAKNGTKSSLKVAGDALCVALGLSNKRNHGQVVVALMKLLEGKSLIIVDGILQVPSAERKRQWGQHQTGVHKRHCRGTTCRRSGKAKTVVLATLQEEDPDWETLYYQELEEWARRSSSPDRQPGEWDARDAELTALIASQRADMEADESCSMLDGCYVSLDRLIKEGFDALLNEDVDPANERTRPALIR